MSKTKVMIDMTKVDWALLRDQKLELIRSLVRGSVMELKTGSKQTPSLLEGVIELVEDIQDQAELILDHDKVFGKRSK